MFLATVQTIIVALFLMPSRMNCEIIAQYKEDLAYANKLCSANIVERELYAHSALSCLRTCSLDQVCRDSIYNSDTETCYWMREGYQQDNCTKELAGARLYKKGMTYMNTREGCPIGWSSVYKSCYRFSRLTYANRETNRVFCNQLHQHAHLADINTEEERDALRKWAYDKNPRIANNRPFWVDSVKKRKKWAWSDGTPVGSWIWAPGYPKDRLYHNDNCMLLNVDRYTFQGTNINCRTKWISGLCKLDY